jgi:CubicO group peptidase (beta-lactamase class C family)
MRWSSLLGAMLPGTILLAGQALAQQPAPARQAGQGSDQELERQLDQELKRQLDRQLERKPHRQLDRQLAAIVADPAQPLSGLAVLAIRDGKVIYEGQFGLARIDTAGTGTSRPVTPDTLFRIASISKMMTTFGLMRLVEAGSVSLDADVSAYLGFTLRNPHFPERPITLRHLLTHTASLRDDAGYSWGTEVALKDVLVRGGSRYGSGAMWAMNAAPGAWFSYANLGWGVIGTVMERVTGERFDRLMRRLLLDPLAIRGGYNPAAFSLQEQADTATLYRRRTTDTEIWHPAGPWIAQVDDFGVKAPTPPAGIERYVPGTNGTLFSPTGGLRVCARDLGKVMLMLAGGGVHEGRRILSAESIALMMREHWRHDGRNGDTLGGLYHSWGLGMQRFDDIDGKGSRLADGMHAAAVGHLGEAYGLISTFAFDPARRDGLISLIGGVGNDPERDPGRYSAHTRAEEVILTTLYRGAIGR